MFRSIKRGGILFPIATKSSRLSGNLKQKTLLQQIQVARKITLNSHHETLGSRLVSVENEEESKKRTTYSWFYRLFFASVPWIIFMSPVAHWLGLRSAEVEAKSDHKSNAKAVESSEQSDDNDEAQTEEDTKKRKRVGFRDRKIIEYENRIREYSTPDKIFRYFATLKAVHDNGEWEVFMTPEDFVRSITPGMKQPEGLGLDQFKKFNMKIDEIKSNLPKDSIFYKLAENGLISFSDYIFLLVILSTPSRMFEIGFKMFDLNGDNSVEFSEFEKMQQIALKQCSIGIKHRDHSTTGSMLKAEQSAITTYFFGKDLDKSMTVERFRDFQEQLNKEILYLEFNRYDPVDGKITEKNFASSLLAFAGFKDTRGKKMMKRIKKAYTDEESQGITFREYMDFYRAMLFINDIDTALTFYTIAGASIDKATLKHVARTVAGSELSDRVIDIVFTLFDENEDGQLSNREFVFIMKRRLTRGLERPKDTGFTRLISSAWHCAIQVVSPFS